MAGSNARNTDPSTSHEAADCDFNPLLREFVEIHAKHPDGLNDHETARLGKLGTFEGRRRRGSDAEQLGYIEQVLTEDGKPLRRIGVSKNANVKAITPQGYAYLLKRK